MKAVFGDTFFFLALINADDAAHKPATQFIREARLPIVTTAWILTELGDGLAKKANRSTYLRLIQSIESNPRLKYIPASEDLFQAGLEIFRTRPDKGWGLTDCISFAVMEQLGITDALTGDQHFVQAGFRALLAE